MTPVNTATVVVVSILAAVVVTSIVLLYVPGTAKKEEVDWQLSTTGSELQQRNRKIGKKYTAEQLNDTLITIAECLNKSGLTDWFVGYGTLLGLARNSSCIDGDDDVDIVINKKDKARLVTALKGAKLPIKTRKAHYMKVCPRKGYPPVDFYLAVVDASGNYHDGHENVTWTNAKPFETLMWHGIPLNIPARWENKLVNRYGVQWRTPRQSKGVYPKKTKL